MEPESQKPVPVGFTMHDGEVYVSLAGLRAWIGNLDWPEPDADGARLWIAEELDLMGIAYTTNLTEA